MMTTKTDNLRCMACGEPSWPHRAQHVTVEADGDKPVVHFDFLFCRECVVKIVGRLQAEAIKIAKGE